MKSVLLAVLIFASLGCAQSIQYDHEATDSYIKLYLSDGDTLVEGLIWKNDNETKSGRKIPMGVFCSWLVEEFVQDTTRIAEIVTQAAQTDSAIAILTRRRAKLVDEYIWRTDYKNTLIDIYIGVKDELGLDCLD